MKKRDWDRILSAVALAAILAAAVVLAPPDAGRAAQGGSDFVYLPFIGRNYQAGLGSVSGIVTDAINGTPLDGQFYEAEVCPEGGACTPTAPNGTYTFTGLPTGVRWLTASAPGYHSFSTPVIIQYNAVVVQNFPLAPDDLGDGQFRIILTWDNDPPDLDAHLYTHSSYLINGKPHVFQGNRGICDGPGQTEACLDLDATEGFGPETITIFEAPPSGSGNVFFQYSVEKYEPCTPACPAPIQASNAIVRVYGSTGLLKTYVIPAIGNPGAKRFWNVFSIEYDGGAFVDIHDINCFTDPPSAEDDPPPCPP